MSRKRRRIEPKPRDYPLGCMKPILNIADRITSLISVVESYSKSRSPLPWKAEPFAQFSRNYTALVDGSGSIVFLTEQPDLADDIARCMNYGHRP